MGTTDPRTSVRNCKESHGGCSGSGLGLTLASDVVLLVGHGKVISQDATLPQEGQLDMMDGKLATKGGPIGSYSPTSVPRVSRNDSTSHGSWPQRCVTFV